VRTRVTFRTAVNTRTISAGRGVNDVKFLVVVVVYFECWDAPPAAFTNFSQIILPAEYGGLVFAAFGIDAQSIRSVNFEQLVLGVGFFDSHIKSMIWSTAAPTQERKFLFGPGNLLISVKIFKIRFGNAAQALLEPPSSSLTNFQFAAILQLAF
jgi:hypothetical protein